LARKRRSGDPRDVGAHSAQLISDLELAVHDSAARPFRPRPVTLIESVDDELVARYRADAASILERMMASAPPAERPLLGFLRDVGRRIAGLLRLATS
jgi:hypothetical protein